jgi:hypothetical protein
MRADVIGWQPIPSALQLNDEIDLSNVGDAILDWRPTMAASSEKSPTLFRRHGLGRTPPGIQEMAGEKGRSTKIVLRPKTGRALSISHPAPIEGCRANRRSAICCGREGRHVDCEHV